MHDFHQGSRAGSGVAAAKAPCSPYLTLRAYIIRPPCTESLNLKTEVESVDYRIGRPNKKLER